MAIDSEGDYLFMIKQAVKMKTPMVSITIDEDAKEDESDKENNKGSDNDEENKKQRKKVSIQPVLNYGSFCSCIMTIECKKPPVYVVNTKKIDNIQLQVI
jgi:hypothetical protein